MAASARALTGGPTQRLELRCHEGAAHDYEARLFASGSDEVLAIVGDITQPKRLQIQLAIADRLAALGTLAAGVAHENRQPLHPTRRHQSVLKSCAGGRRAIRWASGCRSCSSV